MELCAHADVLPLSLSGKSSNRCTWLECCWERHRGNMTYLTSLPLISVRHHGHENSGKVQINSILSASSVFLVHKSRCYKCLGLTYNLVSMPSIDSWRWIRHFNPGFQRFLALGELGRNHGRPGGWGRGGGSTSPPDPCRPWFRPQLSESEDLLKPRVRHSMQ